MELVQGEYLLVYCFLFFIIFFILQFPVHHILTLKKRFKKNDTLNTLELFSFQQYKCKIIYDMRTYSFEQIDMNW